MKKATSFCSIFKLIVSALMVLTTNNVLAEGAAKPDPERVKQETIHNTQYLLANVLQKAKALQDTHHDFAPFGAGLFGNGVVKYVWYAKPGETVQEPAKALPLIRQALTAQAHSNRLLGSAVVYKYGAKDNPQLNVELEYITGFAVAFGSEINFDGDGKVVWGANSQQPFEPRVFVLPEDGKKGEKKEEAKQ